MKKEDIRKVAIDSVGFAGGDHIEKAVVNVAVEAYVFGAQWRIKTVWHDVEMQPEDGRLTIVQFGDNKCLICGNNYSEWNEIVKKLALKRWAYVEDLIPKEE